MAKIMVRQSTLLWIYQAAAEACALTRYDTQREAQSVADHMNTLAKWLGLADVWEARYLDGEWITIA